MPTQVGVRLPAHISAVGKVLLAFHPDEVEEPPTAETLTRFTRNTIVTPERLEEELEAVRESGVAIDQEEAIRDIFCTAAPIYDSDGKVFGAVGLTTTRSRFIRRCDPYLRTARGPQRGDLLAGPEGPRAEARSLRSPDGSDCQELHERPAQTARILVCKL